MRDAFRPFVRPSSGRIRYHPLLPADSRARIYGIRPLRVLIRPWIQPDAVVKSSGLWSPMRHSRHPRVWAFILGAIDEDIERFGLDFWHLYYFKRFADEYLDDDDPQATDGPYIVTESLPICLVRIEMLLLGVGPVSELPLEPTRAEVYADVGP